MKVALVSWTLGLEDPEQLFRKARAIGYKAVQYCGNWRKYPASLIRDTALSYGIELVAYDPYECHPLKREDATLENSIEFYQKVIDYAAALEVPMATIQGLSFWTANQPGRAEAIDQLTEAVKALNSYAKEKGMLLTYEACNHYETPFMNTSEELLELLQRSKADQVKLVMDSFHMNIDEKDSAAALRSLGSSLLYSYHVSDSGRGGIGTGHVDFQKHYQLLKEIGFDGTVCFEFVIDECRPDHLPMNKEQMKEFERQTRESFKVWNQFAQN